MGLTLSQTEKKKITGSVEKYTVMADVHIPAKTRSLRHLISLFSFFLLFWPPLIWDSISNSQVRAREVMLREGAVETYMILAVLRVKFANLPQICELTLTFRGTLNSSP